MPLNHFSRIHFNNILPSTAWVFRMVSLPKVSPPKPCMHLSSPPYVPHALLIPVFLILSPEIYFVSTAHTITIHAEVILTDQMRERFSVLQASGLTAPFCSVLRPPTKFRDLFVPYGHQQTPRRERNRKCCSGRTELKKKKSGHSHNNHL